MTPGFGVGAYHDGGGGKDLGSVLAFRSQIVLAYCFDDRSRLAVAFSRISNASVGDDNPGSEILTDVSGRSQSVACEASVGALQVKIRLVAREAGGERAEETALDKIFQAEIGADEDRRQGERRA